MNPLVVYTAIMGNFGDILQVPENYEDPDGRPIRFVCFSDKISKPVGPWELLQPAWYHESSRRMARYHKLVPHRLFPNHTTLWLDGSMRLVANPWMLVDKYLRKVDMACHKHERRRCVYQEFRACLQLRKDNADVMKRQIKQYQKEGYPHNAGLLETAAFLRHHTSNVERFNETWWEQLSKNSFRDQLSVNYAMWKTKQPCALLPKTQYTSPYFIYRSHR